MITYNEIEDISRPLIVIYERMEDSLIENVASMLDYRYTSDGADIMEWQLRKLQQMGALRQENIRAIARHARKTEAEIIGILTEAGYGAINADDIIYREAFNKGILSGAAIPARYSPVLQSILDNAIANAKDYYNLINTTALESANAQFMSAINQTYLEVVTGVSDYQSAVRKAVRQLADQGITGMTYTSVNGRTTRNHVDVAARRAILTSSAQTAGRMQIARAGEWGSNLVEVSSHIGARPTHAAWQGAIYSIDGGTAQYPNLANATGYGTAGGLCGVNCRHVFYPFFEGLSTQRYNPYDQAYNDRVYEQSQQQRQLERNIREQQRRVTAFEAVGDTEAAYQAKAKLREAKANMESFIDATGRTRRREREAI